MSTILPLSILQNERLQLRLYTSVSVRWGAQTWSNTCNRRNTSESLQAFSVANNARTFYTIVDISELCRGNVIMQPLCQTLGGLDHYQIHYHYKIDGCS